MRTPAASFLLRHENHLRAAEECDGFSRLSMRDDGVPDLSRAAAMRGFRDALDGSLAGRADVIAFQFDGSEARGLRRESRDAAITGAEVRQSDDAARVKKSVGREKLFAHGKLGANFAVGDVRDDDTQHRGEAGCSAFVKVFRG